ncbi:MAG: hypothetical protein EBZ49_00175 [Proteobacteria bacterium]|nr:hypothetical protein [Pseudomonadota bacterium]
MEHGTNDAVTVKKENKFLANTGRVLREIFGQLVTCEFWKQVVKDFVNQMFAAIMMAAGGTLLFHGRKRQNKDILSGMEAEPNQTASKAFGGGFSPSSSFTNNPTYSSGDSRFPGFR